MRKVIETAIIAGFGFVAASLVRLVLFALGLADDDE